MKKILIVGSGISGLSAAIRAAELGMQVVIATFTDSERSQSVMAAGGVNAVLSSENGDSPALHANETFKSGHNIENYDDVVKMCESGAELMHSLEKMGMVFSRDTQGKLLSRCLGGHSQKRTLFSGTATGKQMVSALLRKCRKYERSGIIEYKADRNFLRALIKDGVCYGAIFYNERRATVETIYADYTVIATGGMNSIFGKTTGSAISDGYATAAVFEQGVELRNLEFIQYHPTTVITPLKKMLISEAARAEGGRLFYNNDDGSRCYFMEEKFGSKGNLMPRDVVSKCIYDTKKQCYLDLTFLSEDVLNIRLKEVKDNCKDYVGIDIAEEPIPITPSVHFFMGGIRVNKNHETNIKKLFAVGECASKYHGANRLGGNSLLSAFYSGVVAAETISKVPFDDGKIPNFSHELLDLENDFSKIEETGSKFHATYVEKMIAEIMNENLGITRNEEGLQKGIASVEELEALTEKIHFSRDISPYRAFSLKYRLALAKAILLSAKERKETRGAHIRSDYPEERKEFCCSSLAKWNDGKIEISFEDDNLK